LRRKRRSLYVRNQKGKKVKTGGTTRKIHFQAANISGGAEAWRRRGNSLKQGSELETYVESSAQKGKTSEGKGSRSRKELRRGRGKN